MNQSHMGAAAPADSDRCSRVQAESAHGANLRRAPRSLAGGAGVRTAADLSSSPGSGVTEQTPCVVAAVLPDPQSRRTRWRQRGARVTIIAPSVAMMPLPASWSAPPLMNSSSPDHVDLWVFPVAQRDVAATRGSYVELCRVNLPAQFFVDAAQAVVTPQHSLTVQLAVRIYELSTGASSIVERRLEDSLTETLRLDLVDQLLSNAPPEPPSSGLTKRQRSRLLDYIDQLGNEVDIRVGSLADHLKMPTTVFVRQFVASFHTTPHQFVLGRRIDRAKLLLAERDRSISDVAVSVGFSTPSHFSTAFKLRVGMAPSDYRRLCGPSLA